MEITNLLLYVGVYLLLSYFLFNLILKITDGSNKVIDFFINKFKNGYGNVTRQHLCKKSNQVNANRTTVYDDTELYDSSSEWQD